MRTTDLKLLPRFSDGLTFLYVERARVEQDESAIATAGEAKRSAVYYDGLTLVRVAQALSDRKVRSATAENPSEEVCEGDPPVRGPVEAEKGDGDVPHPERTVLPNEETPDTSSP